MANFLFDKARQKFLNGELSWANNEFKVCLLSSGYSANQIQDETLANIPELSRIAISAALTNKDSTGGVAKAATTTLSGVSATKSIKSLVIFKTAAQLEDSILVAYIDSAGGIGDNGLTATSGTVTIQWNNGEIFKL